MKYNKSDYTDRSLCPIGMIESFFSKRLDVCISMSIRAFTILSFLILSIFPFTTHADSRQENSNIKSSQCNAYNIQIQQRNAPNQLIAVTNNKATSEHHASLASVKRYTYKIINRLEHDEKSFTQGLVFYNSHLYESTGLLGQSKIHKIDIKTGHIIQQNKLANHLFGEGIGISNKQLVQLTWKSERIITYRPDNLKAIKEGKLNGEGWGITSINNHLLFSDGSSVLKWLDNTRGKVESLEVNEQGIAVQGLNELEYANGFIYANVWPTDCIAEIDPHTGNVKAWINLSGLYPENLRPHWTAVLNGIAYQKSKNHFFVTGKYWPYIFEITLREIHQKHNQFKLVGSNINGYIH